MRPAPSLLALLVACTPSEHDSAGVAPPRETGETAPADTHETGGGETGESGGQETGSKETGGGDSAVDTADTDDTAGARPEWPWVCGVDGVPSDSAPLGYVSLAESEAVFEGYGAETAAGDQDGDGCSDLMLGWALFPGPFLGEQDFLDGGAAYLEGEPKDYAIYPSSGDIDGDGLADWVVAGDGVDSGLGGAFVVYGPRWGIVDLWTEADAVLVGQGDLVSPYSVVADQDADGRGDIAIIAGNYAPEAGWPGAVYLQHGPVSGTISLADADGIIEGVSTSTYRGPTNLASGGDLDGDGLTDLTLGAPAAFLIGAVYVFCHPVEGIVQVTDGDAILMGDQGYGFVGSDVSSGGDVDGDGYGDILVGAPQYGDWAGRAYLVLGPISGTHSLSEADATVWAPGLSALVGQSVSLEQDMDGDGRSDVVIGSPGAVGAPNKGAVFVFYESFSGTVNAFDEAEAVLYSEIDEREPYTGGYSGPAGDLNGDGFGDFHTYSSGSQYIIFGGPR